MGFNKRKMEDQRREAAEKEAANRRATEAQVLEDAERLTAAWNERQAKRMPMPFSPTIGAAITAGYWFLWVCCPACRTTNAIDLRTLDLHRDAAVTGLIPALSCRSCRPNAPFAELLRLSRTKVKAQSDVWNAQIKDFQEQLEQASAKGQAEYMKMLSSAWKPREGSAAIVNRIRNTSLHRVRIRRRGFKGIITDCAVVE